MAALRLIPCGRGFPGTAREAGSGRREPLVQRRQDTVDLAFGDISTLCAPSLTIAPAS